MMKIQLIAIATLALLLASPALAANLTIYSTGNTTSSVFVNTRTNVTMFNITVRAIDTDVSVSALTINLVNLSNGITGGNFTKAFVFNGSVGTPAGTNSSIHANVTTGDSIIVNFTTIINITNGSSTVFIAQLEINTNATSGARVAANMTATGNLVTNATSVVANVSLPNSTISTIVSVHANASISPRIVDTAVENQTFLYMLTPTGRDRINRTVINLPSGYTLARLVTVEYEGTNSSSVPTNATAPSQINLTFNTALGGTASTLRVYFEANTSATQTASAAFTSIVDGNVTDVSADAMLTNQTNVTTTGIINLTTVAISKGAAVVNGSDYWEFNMTFTFNATAPGTLHFKMTNWTSQSNSTITLNHSSCAPAPTCASLRTNINASINVSKINVTNNYDTAYGIPISAAFGNLTTMYLRMVIPTGTAIAATWSTTYSVLFRSTS